MYVSIVWLSVHILRKRSTRARAYAANVPCRLVRYRMISRR